MKAPFPPQFVMVEVWGGASWLTSGDADSSCLGTTLRIGDFRYYHSTLPQRHSYIRFIIFLCRENSLGPQWHPGQVHICNPGLTLWIWSYHHPISPQVSMGGCLGCTWHNPGFQPYLPVQTSRTSLSWQWSKDPGGVVQPRKHASLISFL
jgi:hypothetical protein